MAEITPNLGLRALVPRELPHAFNSETLSKLETSAVPRLSNTSVNTTPPSNPNEGDAYYVTSGQADTAWEGVSESVAAWVGSGWVFIPLKVGFYAYIVSEGTNKTYLGPGSGWAAFNEELITSKVFNEIYGAEDFLGNGEIQPAVLHVGALESRDPSSLSTQGYRTHWSGAFGHNSPLSISEILGFEQTFYPVFRYTGQKFKTGVGGSSMPRLLSGRFTASSLLSGDTAPIEVVFIPTEHPDPDQPTSLNEGTPDQYLYEDITNPAVVIAQLPGIAGATEYSEGFNVTFTSDVGYVGFRFQSPCVVAALGHPFGAPHPINLTVEMTVTSSF